MSRQKLFRILIIWGCLVVATALLGKTTVAADNGSAAADFLNIGVSARAAALGGAYTSVTNDATAAYWNPAGLMTLEGAQAAFSHFAWYQDINYEYLAVAYPVSERWTLGTSASYLSYGSIDGYNAFDEPTGEVASTYDMAAGISAAYLVKDNFSLGLTAKYIVVSLAGLSGSALAADIGARYEMDRFTFGLAAVNLGQKIKFDEVSEKLPAAVRVGFSVRPYGSSLLASLEMNTPFYGDIAIKNGYEYCFQEKYFVRTGYAFIPSQDGREFGQSLSFGVGALLGPAHFDYTFSPSENSTSESIHRFSIIMDL
ncbi:MAG: hypothetical protein CVT49_03030 [candidate division Zixibacteria bacterium HGW-Zixibacteria-1]|nr:MAG: hypothetical protein CVT49_03030 [candidate division Zixibacteria bacterium HGW-Zixibacteria-1]